MEFAAHLSGLESALLRDYSTTAHAPAASDDEGCRQVRSRGLAFVPRETAAVVLGEGPRAAVTNVLCSAYKALTV